MAQSYIEDETNERFKAFFEDTEEETLKKRMAILAEKLEGHATLEAEVTGDSLKEVNTKLDKAIEDLVNGIN